MGIDMDSVTYLELQKQFEVYWRNRADRGWYSQFEDKYDAALAAWINGFQQGYAQAQKLENKNDRQNERPL